MTMIAKILLVLALLAAFSVAGYYGAIKEANRRCEALYAQHEKYPLMQITPTISELCPR